MCVILENPADGAVSLEGNSVGDTAVYTCNPGFELIGVAVLICQADGTWDNLPPDCIEFGKNKMYIHGNSV